jgi:hypothetical protein
MFGNISSPSTEQPALAAPEAPQLDATWRVKHAPRHRVQAQTGRACNEMYRP